MSPTLADPVIDEIREIRHRISTMCDHDPRKLVAYFQEIQRQYSAMRGSSECDSFRQAGA